jgi:SAM-dependent methyltransferase
MFSDSFLKPYQGRRYDYQSNGKIYLHMSQPKFSHVSNPTDYMEIAVKKVKNHFRDNFQNKKVLDIPSGNGWIGEALTEYGMDVISADINEEKPHFAQVNMEKPLPFLDEEFDAIICCEGIEHIFSPFKLFTEFSRTLKKGGILIITTPNIQNLYSRLQFLCSGYLFQFDPFNKIPLQENEVGDKGHISNVSYGQLRYYAEHHGMKVSPPTGGRMKRIILVPFLFPFLLIGIWWNFRDWKRTSGKKHQKEIIKHLFSPRVLLSRSLVFISSKPK